MPAEYPKSFAECDKWEFFVNGKAISIQKCYDMVKRNQHFPYLSHIISYDMSHII